MKRKVGGRILVDAKVTEKRIAETLRPTENKNAFLPGVYIKHFFPSVVGFKCISRKKMPVKKSPVCGISLQKSYYSLPFVLLTQFGFEPF